MFWGNPLYGSPIVSRFLIIFVCLIKRKRVFVILYSIIHSHVYVFFYRSFDFNVMGPQKGKINLCGRNHEWRIWALYFWIFFLNSKVFFFFIPFIYFFFLLCFTPFREFFGRVPAYLVAHEVPRVRYIIFDNHLQVLYILLIQSYDFNVMEDYYQPIQLITLTPRFELVTHHSPL